MDRISLITCARHRPEKLKELLESIEKTADKPSEIEFVFGVEPDDTPVIKVIDDWRHKNKDYRIILRIWTVEEVGFTLNQKYNMLANTASYELVSGCGDDLEFLTQGWDTKIREYFSKVPDRILLAWVNDGPGSERLPRHYTVHKNWINLMGSYTTKFLKHYFSDNWAFDIAISIGRACFMRDVEVLHKHPVFGNAEVDDNHMKDNGLFTSDGFLYNAYKGHQKYEIDKLLKFINGDKNA